MLVCSGLGSRSACWKPSIWSFRAIHGKEFARSIIHPRWHFHSNAPFERLRTLGCRSSKTTPHNTYFNSNCMQRFHVSLPRLANHFSLHANRLLPSLVASETYIPRTVQTISPSSRPASPRMPNNLNPLVPLFRFAVLLLLSACRL